MLRQLLVGFVCAVILAGCSSTDPVAPVAPGELVKVDLLGRYDVAGCIPESARHAEARC